MEDFYILIVIFVLISINGFYAASEMALVSLNRMKIMKLAKEGNKKAIILKKVSFDSTRYLSTIQVAITLAGFLSSAIAGSNLANNLIDAFIKLDIVLPLNFAVVLITLILSFITLVFGELVPKRVALNNPEKFALFSARIIYITMIITRPAVWLLSISTKAVVKLFKLDKNPTKNHTSEDEIKHLIRSGHIQGLYQEKEKEMLENIFKFDDITAEAIMTPRTDVFAIDLKANKSEILDQIINSNYSRIPVYEKTIDNIKGIIHIKDVLIQAKEVGFSRLNFKKLIRDPYYVPNNIKINALFKRMQKQNYQIAILLDHYGGIDGIITMEDILEEIVGNIYDEYDELEERIKKIGEGIYLVDGLVQIQDLNRYLNLDIEDDFETLSGLIIDKLGYIPKKKVEKSLFYQNLEIKIKSLKKNHIDKVILVKTSKNG
jgi:putative hemolysin